MQLHKSCRLQSENLFAASEIRSLSDEPNGVTNASPVTREQILENLRWLLGADGDGDGEASVQLSLFTSRDTAMERNSSQLTSPPFRTMNSQKWSTICSQKMPHWLASLIVVMGQRCYNHCCPGISWHLERQSTEESRRNWTWDHPGWLCQAHKSVHSLLESTSEDVTCFSKSWTWDWKARSVSNVFKRRKYGTAARTQSTTCGTGTPFPTAERYVWSLKEPFWKDVTPKHQTSQSESIPTRVPAIIHLDGLNW